MSAGGSDGSVLIGRGTRAAGNVPDLAWRPLLLVALALAGLLVAVSGRYGYHRDELYFLQAGRHLAWGYPDQPPFTPALTRLVTALAGSSLVALRLPSAIAAGAVVLMTGMLARELGGRRSAQVLAAAAMAASSLLMLVGHLTSTTTFDLVAWTALTLLTVKVLRTGEERLWLIAGAVAGVGLLNKTLLVLLLAALAAALVLAGPRARLASRWLWLGVLLTLLVWAPNLWWQARHGWPQLALNSAIAAGSSGSSEPRWLFLPYQLVLVSPLLVPVWVVGLVRLLRDPGLRWAHSLGVAYVLLVVVFLVADGKPYYICGLYPALLAAGAAPVLDWAARGRHRTALVSATVALAAGVSAVLMLPLVPADALHRTPIMAINYDAGETVGWPRFARSLADAYAQLPTSDRRSAVILTGNYGEAGAVDRYGPALGLPAAYSGHNGYALWGPPPEGAAPVLSVGIPEERLRQLFGSVRAVGRIDNGLEVDNDEQGATIWLCRDLRASWTDTWPTLVRLG